VQALGGGAEIVGLRRDLGRVQAARAVALLDALDGLLAGPLQRHLPVLGELDARGGERAALVVGRPAHEQVLERGGVLRDAGLERLDALLELILGIELAVVHVQVLGDEMPDRRAALGQGAEGDRQPHGEAEIAEELH
jgi:hypothetical protein